MPHQLKITVVKDVQTQEEFDAMMGAHSAGHGIPLEVWRVAQAMLKLPAYQAVGLLVRADIGAATFRQLFVWDNETGALEFASSLLALESDNPPVYTNVHGGVWIVLKRSPNVTPTYLKEMLYLALYLLDQNKGRAEQEVPLLTYPGLEVTVCPPETTPRPEAGVGRSFEHIYT